MSRGYCSFWPISVLKSVLSSFCHTQNVPLAQSYEEDIKQISSVNTYDDDFFGDFFRYSVKTLKSWLNFFMFQIQKVRRDVLAF